MTQVFLPFSKARRQDQEHNSRLLSNFTTSPPSTSTTKPTTLEHTISFDQTKGMCPSHHSLLHCRQFARAPILQNRPNHHPQHMHIPAFSKLTASFTFVSKSYAPEFLSLAAARAFRTYMPSILPPTSSALHPHPHQQSSSTLTSTFFYLDHHPTLL